MHTFLGPILQKVHFAQQVRHLKDGFNVICEIAFTRASSVFHNTMRNENVELNLYIHILSNITRFGYVIAVLIHNGEVFGTAFARK